MTNMDTTLRHKVNRFHKRLIFWYDPDTCQFILPNGKRHTTPEPLKLVPLMNAIQNHARTHYEGTGEVNLFIRAGSHSRYKPDPDWFHVGLGWQKLYSSYDKLHGAYERGGFKIWMWGTGVWFGDELDLNAIHDTYYKLEKAIGRYLQRDDYILLSTPAQTGKDLLECLLPKGQEYGILPKDLRDLISSNFAQGRYEYFPQGQTAEDGADIIDGSFMYASCISWLPTGKYIHDTIDEIELVTTSKGSLYPPYPGLYLVTFTVPENWNHIGLLKAPPRHKGDNNYYPNDPGQTFTNWVTGYELALAISNPLNIPWHYAIHERIIWPETEKRDGKRQPDPFADWRKMLVHMREGAITKIGSKQGELLAGAYRNILMHTIGSLKAKYQYKEIVKSRSEAAHLIHAGLLQPAKNKPMRMTKDGLLFNERIELPEHKLKFYHPEWTAIIWGKSRTRLAKFALSLIYERIIAFRLDSVWYAGRWDSSLDKKLYKPGEFRVKPPHIPPFVRHATNGEFIEFIRNWNLSHKGTNETIDDDTTPESEE